MELLITYSVSFVVSHMILSASPVRARLVGAMGTWPFLAVYSLIAIGLFWGFLRAYMEAPHEILWQPPIAFRHLAISVVPLCCIFVVAGYTSGNPSALGFRQMVSLPEQPVGIFRVTRHPVMWAVGLWAISHLLATGVVASMVLFFTLATLAFAGAVHMDLRTSREQGAEWDAFMSRTSNIPFLAILQGRQFFNWREIGLLRFFAAGLLYAGLLYAHGAVIGVSPLPMP